MKKIKLSIEGMHCAGCASNVERSLKKIPGVKSVSVSIMTKKGFIEADETVSDEALMQAVAHVGYKAAKVM